LLSKALAGGAIALINANATSADAMRIFMCVLLSFDAGIAGLQRLGLASLGLYSRFSQARYSY
jgi:hypothetical protein